MDIRNQVSIFGSFDFNMTPENVVKVLTLFQSYNMVPMPFREVDATNGKVIDRMAIRNQNGLAILFHQSRVDIISERQSESSAPDNIEFLIAHIIPKVIQAGANKSNRVAVITEYFLQERDGINEKMFELLYRVRDSESASDWVYRYCDRGSHNNHLLNKIIELTRTQGEFGNETGAPVPFDKIKVSIDINTDQNNEATRFEENGIVDIANILNEQAAQKKSTIQSWVDLAYA